MCYPFSVTIKLHKTSNIIENVTIRGEMMKHILEQLITAVMWVIQTLLFILLVILTSSLIEYVVCVVFYTFFGGE